MASRLSESFAAIKGAATSISGKRSVGENGAAALKIVVAGAPLPSAQPQLPGRGLAP